MTKSRVNKRPSVILAISVLLAMIIVVNVLGWAVYFAFSSLVLRAFTIALAIGVLSYITLMGRELYLRQLILAPASVSVIVIGSLESYNSSISYYLPVIYALAFSLFTVAFLIFRHYAYRNNFTIFNAH